MPTRYFGFVGAAGALLPDTTGLVVAGVTGVTGGGVTGGRSKLFVGMVTGELAGDTG